MASTGTVLQNIKATTQATLDAIGSRDYDALIALRSEDFAFQTLPLSLGQPELNNAQYRELWYGLLVKIFADLKVVPTKIMFDAEARQSVVHGYSHAKLANGREEKLELVQFMSFDENGENLVRLEEFFDSKSYLEMLAGGEGGAHEGAWKNESFQ